MTPEEKNEQKDVQYYSALVNAWLSTKQEKDKSIMVLSTAGIGFLITFSSSSITSSQLPLYMLSLLFFNLSILTILLVFNWNASHIEDVINNSNADQVNDKASKIRKLTIADYTISISFLIAVVLLSILGYNLALTKIESKEKNMNKPQLIGDSFNGINKLNPATGKKSFNGIANLQAQPTTPSVGNGGTENSPTTSSPNTATTTTQGEANTGNQENNSK